MITAAQKTKWAGPVFALCAALAGVIYWRATQDMYKTWRLEDSYYSHGFLIPIISLYFVWRRREEIWRTPWIPSPWGHAWIGAAVGLHVVAFFLGFRVGSQLSLVMALIGFSLIFLGARVTRMLWFPLAYLLFMVPIPSSLTASIALQLKLFAAKCSVAIANAMGMVMAQQGSYIYFGDDRLIIGDVCAGLRSLIALLAFGALMAYISKTDGVGRVILLAMSPPIAIIANVFRIWLLCVIAYFFGSEVAAGKAHDVSGILIFVVAFILFFSLESQLRRWRPQKSQAGEPFRAGLQEAEAVRAGKEPAP